VNSAIPAPRDPEISDRVDEYKGDAQNSIDEACRHQNLHLLRPEVIWPPYNQAAMAARSWTGLIYAENLRSLAVPVKDPKTGEPNRIQWFHFGMRFINAAAWVKFVR
jgi:hypothetical protein